MTSCYTLTFYMYDTFFCVSGFWRPSAKSQDSPSTERYDYVPMRYVICLHEFQVDRTFTQARALGMPRVPHALLLPLGEDERPL